MEEIIKLEITGHGYDGEGVARHNGKVVFVPFALSGELVEAKVVKEKTSFSQAKLVKVIKESQSRCQPPCPYFGICGGCRLQHTSYENEVNIKVQLLKNQLAKVGYEGGIEVHPSKQDYQYRNKIKLFLSGDELGLSQRGSNKICDIQNCLLVKKEISKAIEAVRGFVFGNKLQCSFKNIYIRCEDDKVLLEFVLQKPCKINYSPLLLLLGRNSGIFEQFQGVSRHVCGMKSLSTKEFGLDCEFSPSSFHQINDDVAEEMYRQVLENIAGENVVNCYSGAGVLSGIIARFAARVTGIELGKKEHQDAEILKKKNNLENLENICGDCAEVLPQIDCHVGTLVVDPPRAGLDESVCKAIGQIDYERLIYISCDSATLVRDLQRIGGLKIEKAAFYDMFPRTSEYETLLFLTKV